MGPALQTRAHTPYSDPVTRVSRALSGARTRCWGLGPLHPRLLPPGFGRSRTPLYCLDSHLTPCPLSYTHTGSGARAHTLDIPIVPHVTHGPNVPTLHTRSRTRAHTRTHKQHTASGHFPAAIPDPQPQPHKATH